MHAVKNTFVVLGLGLIVLATALPAQANGRHHPMRVLNERIALVQDQIGVLTRQVRSGSMSRAERREILLERRQMFLRLAYLKASRVHLARVPQDHQVAFTTQTQDSEASPTDTGGGIIITDTLP